MIEERFEFTAKTKKNIIIFMGVGLLLTVLGVVILYFSGGHGQEEAAGDGHDFHWTKRVIVNIWINNVFYAGLSLIGIFFFALQYAAQAGWSSGIKRIPLSFGAWLPIGLF